MILGHYVNPDNGTEITLETNGEDRYVMWYKDAQNPRYWVTNFTPSMRYPTYHRHAKRYNNSLRDYAINEFNLAVSIQKDGIELRALVRNYEERCWAEECNLEDLPMVMTWMKDPDALDIVERRLLRRDVNA